MTAPAPSPALRRQYRAALARLAAYRVEHQAILSADVPAVMRVESWFRLNELQQAVSQARRAVIEEAWGNGRLKDAHPLREAVEALLREAEEATHE